MTPAKSTPLTLRDKQPAPVPAQAMTPMDMLATAIERGMDIGILDKLMGLQERHEANLGRKAFDAAIAAAKAEIPVIIKDRKVGFDSKKPGASSTHYKHESLGEIARTIDPILAKHGLSYRWRSAQGEGGVTVTCVLSHKDGHSEETTLKASADNSGNKNSIQAIASTTTYLSRYTLKMALGLATAEADDDGKASESAEETISAEQVAELEKLAEEVGANKQAFFNYAKIESFADILVKHFARAKRDLEAVRRRKSPEAEQNHA